MQDGAHFTATQRVKSGSVFLVTLYIRPLQYSVHVRSCHQHVRSHFCSASPHYTAMLDPYINADTRQILSILVRDATLRHSDVRKNGQSGNK
jgi:hypothetical protein